MTRAFLNGTYTLSIEVSEVASAKKWRPQSRPYRRCVVDTEIPLERILLGFAGFFWFPGSILNFRIGSVPSMRGVIAVTLFAATISDSQSLPMLINKPPERQRLQTRAPDSKRAFLPIHALIFHSLVFRQNQRNPPKTPRIVYPSRVSTPVNSRETRENGWKHSKYQGSSLLRKDQGRSKHQGMEDQGGP